MKKILITESYYSLKQINILKKKFKIIFLDENCSQHEFDNLIKNNEIYAIFLRLGLSINKKFYFNEDTLKYIFTPTTGTNNISIPKFSNCKVVSLKSSKDFLKKIPSTAEHAWSLLLESQRELRENNILKSNKLWTRKNININEISYKKIGLIGLGRIGKKIAKYAESFDMSVFFTEVKDIAYSKKYKKLNLVKLLNTCDYIIISSDYTGKKILTSSILKRIKRQIKTLINISRGELIDEKALCKAINQNKIYKYYTDVLVNDSSWFGVEYKDNNLYKMSLKLNNRIFITPHIGGFSKESIFKTRFHIMNEAISILK